MPKLPYRTATSTVESLAWLECAKMRCPAVRDPAVFEVWLTPVFAVSMLRLVASEPDSFAAGSKNYPSNTI